MARHAATLPTACSRERARCLCPFFCHVVSQLLDRDSANEPFHSVSEIANQDAPVYMMINQGETFYHQDYTFYFCNNPLITSVITDKHMQTIGDIANCVTGFYSGNDKKYLHPVHGAVKNAAKYVIAPNERILKHEVNSEEKKSGIETGDSLVPIIKGGNIQFVKKTEWYMDWSKNAFEEYKLSGKCRLQNSDYYFKQDGIAIPMIRSKKISAALIEGRLIDQSVVGVFPHDESLVLYLLAFFILLAQNSSMSLIQRQIILQII